METGTTFVDTMKAKCVNIIYLLKGEWLRIEQASFLIKIIK